jgi:hypothetical protein
MKCSKIYCFGMFGLSAYLTLGLTQGSIVISPYIKTRNDAKRELDDAQNKYNSANKDYLESQGKVDDAQSTITDATCYLNNSNTFMSQLQNYCLLAIPGSNSVNVLEKNYGIELVFLPDKTIETTGSDVDRVCHTVPYKKCDDNGQNCHTDTRRDCKYVTYYFPQYTHEYHGATAQGPGSQLILSCGKFSYAISANAETKSTKTAWKSFLAFPSLRITEQTRDIIFTSKVKTTISIDNVATNPLTFIIESTETNLAAAANAILIFIKQQCATLNASFKPMHHYQEIIDTLTKVLPKLREEAEAKKEILDQATTYRNQRQAEFNKVNGEFITILIGLLIAVAALPAGSIWCLRKKEQEYANQNYEGRAVCDSITPVEFCRSNPFAGCFAVFKEKTNRLLTCGADIVEQNPSVGISSSNNINNPIEEGEYSDIEESRHGQTFHSQPPIARVVSERDLGGEEEDIILASVASSSEQSLKFF